VSGATIDRNDPEGEATKPISTQSYHLRSCTRFFGPQGLRQGVAQGVEKRLMVACSVLPSSGSVRMYQLSGVAESLDDYYTGAGEASGRWAGIGAGCLGLTGGVRVDDLSAVSVDLPPHAQTGRQRKLLPTQATEPASSAQPEPNPRLRHRPNSPRQAGLIFSVTSSPVRR
jgi:hypothetical protein